MFLKLRDRMCISSSSSLLLIVLINLHIYLLYGLISSTALFCFGGVRENWNFHEMGMGMSPQEWEGMGITVVIPHISILYVVVICVIYSSRNANIIVVVVVFVAVVVVVNFINNAVASLGLVSPGAATDGVTRIISGKNDDFFCSSLSLLLISLGCHTPLRVCGCHPAPFSPVRPRLSTILCKFTHTFFRSGVTPRVSPGAVRPPVTPLN